MAGILIIDDQFVSRQILSVLLRSISENHEVKEFSCAQEALDWATQNPVALILTDYKMPVMNGIEFIRQFRCHTACDHVPVIMVSGDIDQETREAALEAGAADFFLKPVNHEECLDRCRALLDVAN